MRIVKWIVPVVVFGLILAGWHARAVAEDTKKETGTISGKVVDKDDKAVGSAKIRLMAKTEGKTEGKSGSKAETKLAKGSKAAPVAETTSDSEGKYTLKDVAPGSYTLNARVRGVGKADKDVDVKAG